MPCYNWDREKLPQINLLIVVSQKTKVPVWFDQLPRAINDVKTLRDTIKLLSHVGIKSRKIVLNRGYASQSNMSILLTIRVKFIMGIPLYRFSQYRKFIEEADSNHEFDNLDNTLQLFDDYETAQTQGATKLLKIDEH